MKTIESDDFHWATVITIGVFSLMQVIFIQLTTWYLNPAKLKHTFLEKLIIFNFLRGSFSVGLTDVQK